MSTVSPLDQLKRYGRVCAASALYRAAAPFGVDDAVLDASTLLVAAQHPDHAVLVRGVVAACASKPPERMADELMLRIGQEWLKQLPGHLQCAVDARLAFDAAATIARATRIVELFAKAGVDRTRLLIAVCGNWEGIQAAKALEHQGISCSVVHVYTLVQAAACAEVGATRVSVPSADAGNAGVAADPLGQQIYTYYRRFGIGTEVCVSDLADRADVEALAGCDVLALDLPQLQALQSGSGDIARRLDPVTAAAAAVHAMTHNEASFRTALNDDATACERLASGIRSAAATAAQLQQFLSKAHP
jgi:transaldolase